MKELAELGSVWELNGKVSAIVLVVGAYNRSDGTYPCVMLASDGSWSTQPGERLNVMVTHAKAWRRLV